MSYNKHAAESCLNSLGFKPKRILVVGAGAYGEDVKILNELTGGQAEIHGVDIVQDVGSQYKADNVCYLNCSVNEMPYVSEYFDLAYSFATFEHIKNLKDGWQSMLKVLRSGGVLYSLSSPLWHSPSGHHKSFFTAHPWVHLAYPTPDKLLEFCIKEKIQSPDSTDIIHHINYMLHDEYFNKLKPSDYSKAAEMLVGCEIDSKFNSIDISNYPDHENILRLGFSLEDITNITHYLRCKKY